MGFALDISALRQAIGVASKKMSFQASALEKDGGFYFFTRSRNGKH